MIYNRTHSVMMDMLYDEDCRVVLDNVGIGVAREGPEGSPVVSDSSTAYLHGIRAFFANLSKVRGLGATS